MGSRVVASLLERLGLGEGKSGGWEARALVERIVTRGLGDGKTGRKSKDKCTGLEVRSALRFSAAVAAVVALAAVSACAPARQVSRPKPHDDLVIATATSLEDSRLLDTLVPEFSKASGRQVRILSVGSGEAMALGRAGKADVLLVNSPGDEKKFVDDGFGVNRRTIARNDFVLVGPTSDPAKILDMRDATAALKKIASAAGARFVSRSDQSGANTRERQLWNEANLAPSGSWYLKSGTGMGETLRISGSRSAYTLTDIATYMVNQRNAGLGVMVRDRSRLRNAYSVIEVNPKKFSAVNAEAAGEFTKFITGPEAQRIIAEFGKEKYGRALFEGAGD